MLRLPLGHVDSGALVQPRRRGAAVARLACEDILKAEQRQRPFVVLVADVPQRAENASGAEVVQAPAVGDLELLALQLEQLPGRSKLVHVGPVRRLRQPAGTPEASSHRDEALRNDAAG